MTANYLTPMTTSDPTPTTTQPPTVPEDLLMSMINESVAVGSFESTYSRELARRVAGWAWRQRDQEVRQAVQLGADKELEACCEYVEKLIAQWVSLVPCYIAEMRRTRRPNTRPTPREQALAVLRTAENDGAALTTGDVALIRQALQ
jgi:hypothetical protein